MTPVGAAPTPVAPVSGVVWVHPQARDVVAWAFSDGDHPFEVREQDTG